MIRILGAALLAALLGGVAVAAPLAGDKTYDLLFRGGTLDEIDRDAALVYHREVTNTLKPDAAERDTGDIALSFREGEMTMALLQFGIEYPVAADTSVNGADPYFYWVEACNVIGCSSLAGPASGFASAAFFSDDFESGTFDAWTRFNDGGELGLVEARIAKIAVRFAWF